VSSNDKTRRVDGCIRQTERRYDSVTAPFGGSEMDEQNLILVVVDDASKFGATPNQVARGELALEYGVLQMIAVPAHGLEDFAQTLVVADVVTNQIGLPHLLVFLFKIV
jgi:hypothetical protein